MGRPIRVTGPVEASAEKSFKGLIQRLLNVHLKGTAGYILVAFGGKMWQCERDNVNPEKPYAKQEVKYHPLALLFTSQKAVSA